MSLLDEIKFNGKNVWIKNDKELIFVLECKDEYEYVQIVRNIECRHCFGTKWHVVALEDYEVKNIKLIKKDYRRWKKEQKLKKENKEIDENK